MFFFYGQFWVSNEYNEIKIKKNGSDFVISAETINPSKNDVSIIKELGHIGFKVIKILKLKFAYGFHYHCLKINHEGKIHSINNFVKKMKLNNNVFCIDSSVIEKIGLKPPTKTYLATAEFLLKKIRK